MESSPPEANACQYQVVEGIVSPRVTYVENGAAPLQDGAVPASTETRAPLESVVCILPSDSLNSIPPPKPDFYAPPPYEEVASPSKLPTYEEVELEKTLEEQPPEGNRIIQLGPHRVSTQRILIDGDSTEELDTSLLGTDFMFYIAFFVAFIFNWIGFLLLMCFCHTIAARYGALSGFGLSLAKWTFIVRHSTSMTSKDNGWLWWLIMTFGLIICVRAIFQYVTIKRGWHILSASHRERLIFFY